MPAHREARSPSSGPELHPARSEPSELGPDAGPAAAAFLPMQALARSLLPAMQEFLEASHRAFCKLYAARGLPPPKPPSEGQDLVQETCVAFLSRPEPIREPPSWFLVTLTWRCRLYWRRRALRERWQLPVDPAALESLAGPQPPEQERQALLAQVAAAVATLPARSRSLLLHRYALGETGPDLARGAGYRRGSVAKTLRRAVRKLAADLEAE